ncbi:MAG: hypothetical protein GKS00_19650 [Alphaproteobacteria bacterium]|nr:hypothetical protein [Alphaproteobacteria bacterium]
MTVEWIDRQMPKGEEVFLDHVGYFASDLHEAGNRLARLGFQTSSVNVQYNSDAAGELVPSGTSNRLAKLRRGFIEILAATSETPLAGQLRRGLARYEGLHVIALTNPDMERQRTRLLDAGFAMQPLVNLRRRISAPDGGRQMAYSILRTESDVMPEGRVQMLTTHTPELFWTPGVSVHDNRADGLTDLLICVDDPLEAADRFSRFTNRDAAATGDFYSIALDRGRILVARAERVAAVLPGFEPPDMPYVVGQGIRSVDLETTERVLRRGEIRPIMSNNDIVCVGPADALGAYLLFHTERMTHPWSSLMLGAVC